MIKSRWQQYKENMGSVRPWDLVNPNQPKISDEIAQKRLNICKECPELIQSTIQCKKCLCFMNLKTKLFAATCPIGKW